ncbi:hypothetical protein DP113_15215 [Brasilonema octagenarum UFV-E1]|jgi:hypothetical protein|uniref:Microviridin/marinostatin family tricyclic proteinase inhibitor n=2 Tax=Brasilonema TaxID=383614 RepID=A0A856MFQ7_9CYAN|nr:MULTISPECIES: microviridin/marinostatin family tricyclic proteinase inhibitor [Brasilonema]NMF61290.1 hypothetical protein [Brasilonema octagenarum UFV-OR1]QDL09080.1 hypothetical protein DP114_15275 [Brasilonema sennae CENA114]QDL15438.1 hypothetical protein DP113_15215 [Brasilonema octagenarum UFV-E1]
MSKNTVVKPSDVKAVPFFARFLEEQASQESNTAPVQTLKYPSDWEDY